jgi:flagellar motility protein MotE (MotC chaperone)
MLSYLTSFFYQTTPPVFSCKTCTALYKEIESLRSQQEQERLYLKKEIEQQYQAQIRELRQQLKQQKKDTETYRNLVSVKL